MMMANSGVSTTAVDDDWYGYILQNLEWIMADIDSIEDFSEDIALNTWDNGSFLYEILKVLGTDEDGTMAAMLSSTLEYFADTAGWLGVYDGGLQLNELFDVLNSSVLSVGGSVSSFYSSFSDWVVSWDSFRKTLVLPAGSWAVGFDGKLQQTSSSANLLDYLRFSLSGFARSFITSPSSSSRYLGVNGEAVALQTGDQLLFSSVFNSSMLGLMSGIKSISSGSYSLTLFDSDKASQSAVTAPTMGNMIHQYFNSMQDDLGALTFIHADSEAVQAKKDAANNTVAVTDSFLKPGSAGSVGVSDIGDAAEAVSGTKDLFDTGVSIGQAFDQLQGSGPLEFFTAQTAANLNTVPATYSDDDDFVHFYDPSNSEFFELIGKGGN